MSFRARVAVLVALVVAVAVVSVAGSFLYMARGQAIDSIDSKLRLRAVDIPSLGEKFGRLHEFDRRLFGKYAPDDVLVQVFDGRGRIWASNNYFKLFLFIPPSAIIFLLVIFDKFINL